MRYYDEDDAANLGAKPWQTDLLLLNPEYISWGPHEDYMWKTGSGWDSAQSFNSWSDFGPWALDDLNECVSFYFSVERDSEECSACGGNGYNNSPEAQKVVRTFYQHSCHPGEVAWNTAITQDEADMLIEAGRVHGLTTAAQINAAQYGSGLYYSHDAINRHMLIQHRLKRMGYTENCSCCGGRGYVYTAPEPYVVLTLWWLHPRKGCSRGVEVKNIQQNEIDTVKAFLREAAARNANRFSKLGDA